MIITSSENQLIGTAVYSPDVCVCDNTLPFIQSLQYKPYEEAYLLILEPLTQCCSTPENIKVKYHILSLIKSNAIRLDVILKNLEEFKNLNRYDLMIHVLLTINGQLPQSAIKYKITDLVIYLIGNKYLHRTDNANIYWQIKSNNEQFFGKLVGVDTVSITEDNEYNTAASSISPVYAMDQITSGSSSINLTPNRHSDSGFSMSSSGSSSTSEGSYSSLWGINNNQINRPIGGISSSATSGRPSISIHMPNGPTSSSNTGFGSSSAMSSSSSSAFASASSEGSYPSISGTYEQPSASLYPSGSITSGESSSIWMSNSPTSSSNLPLSAPGSSSTIGFSSSSAGSSSVSSSSVGSSSSLSSSGSSYPSILDIHKQPSRPEFSSGSITSGGSSSIWMPNSPTTSTLSAPGSSSTIGFSSSSAGSSSVSSSESSHSSILETSKRPSSSINGLVTSIGASVSNVQSPTSPTYIISNTEMQPTSSTVSSGSVSVAGGVSGVVNPTSSSIGSYPSTSIYQFNTPSIKTPSVSTASSTTIGSKTSKLLDSSVSISSANVGSVSPVYRPAPALGTIGWNSGSYTTGGSYNVGTAVTNTVNSGQVSSESISSHGTNCNSCKCQNSLVKFLINKLLSTKVTNSNQRPFEVNIQQDDVSVINKILLMFPTPRYPLEQQYYTVIRGYLSNPKVIEYINSLNLPTNIDGNQLFGIILPQLISSTTDTNVLNALRFYSNVSMLNTKTNFLFSNLLYLIPAPSPNSQDQVYYNIIRGFLQGKDIYSILGVLNLNGNENLDQIYTLVLNKIITHATIPEYIRQAFINYTKKELSINFGYNYATLIPLIPMATTDQEVNMYNSLKRLFESSTIQKYLINVKPEQYTNSNDLLQVVLRTIITSNIPNDMTSSAQYYYNKIYFTPKGIDVPSLFQIISQTTQNTVMQSIIRNFVYSNEFLTIIPHVQPATDSQQLLEMILNKMLIMKRDKDTLATATFFLKQLNTKKVQVTMNKIIQLLPAPRNAQESNVYKLVSRFLLGPSASVYLEGIDVSLFSDKYLLDLIMRRISEESNNPEIRTAFEYYVQMNEKLTSLDLIARKEYKKQFQLTSIFTDTLNLNTLTFDQKVAFKTFFKFISEMNPGIISHFASWDQATTRGEFMKFFFEFLLQNADVPIPIRQCIFVLRPLIQMNGRGALPP